MCVVRSQNLPLIARILAEEGFVPVLDGEVVMFWVRQGMKPQPGRRRVW